MERFANKQQVKVIDPDIEHEPLTGKIGQVVRLRIQDQAAWVEMDEPLPEKLAVFENGDPRRNHVMLYPDECEAVTGTS